jgi:hypothetical protein
VVALRSERRALADRQAFGPRARERIAHGLRERIRNLIRWLTQLPDAVGKRLGGVGER